MMSLHFWQPPFHFSCLQFYQWIGPSPLHQPALATGDQVLSESCEWEVIPEGSGIGTPSPQLVALLRSWCVWRCWRKCITVSSLWEFTASPYFQAAFPASCVRLKAWLVSFRLPTHCLPLAAAVVPYHDGLLPSGAWSQNKLFLGSPLVTVFYHNCRNITNMKIGAREW